MYNIISPNTSFSRLKRTLYVWPFLFIININFFFNKNHIFIGNSNRVSYLHYNLNVYNILWKNSCLCLNMHVVFQISVDKSTHILYTTYIYIFFFRLHLLTYYTLGIYYKLYYISLSKFQITRLVSIRKYKHDKTHALCE